MKRLFVILTLALLLGLPNYAQAKKLIITTTAFPPHIIVENGKVTGILTEIVEEVLKRNGIEAEIRNVPWKRALKEVEEGSSDAIFAPIHNEERTKFLYFPSEKLGSEKTVIMSLSGSGIKASKLDDLKDKNVGVVRGYSYTPEFDKSTDIKKTECDDEKQLIKVLGVKRLDFVIGEESTLKYVAKQAGIQIETLFVLTEVKNFLCLSQKAFGEKGKELAEKFSKTLQELNKEGFIEKVKSKYF